jgi:hypothetical protein
MVRNKERLHVCAACY